MNEEPTIPSVTKAALAGADKPARPAARKPSAVAGKRQEGKTATAAAKAMPARITLPTPARELAEAVVQRLGRAQALRIQHALGAVLKKAAAVQEKPKTKPTK